MLYVYFLGSRYPRSTSLDYVVKDNHKPVFADCSTYNPSVKEEEPRNTHVIRVSLQTAFCENL